ncbi:NAD-dependent dehydratase [Skermanella stibiiresistens SB22]|uniref:NAD-dependent dehydratase n=1 Tax=Skermanella stibiiresistens SB22 TaxID=1385369 RepID=W9H2V8_9PROT|nr:SDR family NAD(P)-dependent oxidoreductase [Skermanella stibiiresistens]EWY38103.1 NAD-dependent dehydratase [Skermanella stibiiresistens SB22]
MIGDRELPGNQAADLPGFTVDFHPEDRDHVERTIATLKRLGVRRLRVSVSDDAATGWLLPRLATEFDVLPCLNLDDALDDGDAEALLAAAAPMLEWVEIAATPAKASSIAGVAEVLRRAGLKVVLSGLDPATLEPLADRGALSAFDAIGITAFSGTGDASWHGWDTIIGGYREALAGLRRDLPLWITATGFSTWRHDERGQIRAFLATTEAPVDRVYWSSLADLAATEVGPTGFHADERDYALGILRADGSPKLLGRLLETGGIGHVRAVDRLGRPGSPRPASLDGAGKPVVITGGAGFIGTNLADRLVREGHRVVVYDNLSRAGVERNIEWLKATHGGAVTFELADIRDPHVLGEAVARAGKMFHFAAQVAVTTSLVDPITDFEINARGTVNLLEAMRAQPEPPPLVFTSTNKVYGKLADVELRLEGEHYAPADLEIRAHGIDESRPLDFYSPYGASKGSADQYVLDYSRTYDLPTAVFRMSCIYGPHQFGTEDQGWVAHFLIRALQGEPITLYGDGRQVRDILFVDDLVDAFMAAQEHMPAIRGKAFNIGGGPANATSLIELLERIGATTGRMPDISFGPWRPGDQLYYVSDTAGFGTATGWRPSVGVAEGIDRLADWLTENRVAQPLIDSAIEPVIERRAAS